MTRRAPLSRPTAPLHDSPRTWLHPMYCFHQRSVTMHTMWVFSGPRRYAPHARVVARAVRELLYSPSDLLSVLCVLLVACGDGGCDSVITPNSQSARSSCTSLIDSDPCHVITMTRHVSSGRSLHSPHTLDRSNPSRRDNHAVREIKRSTTN